MNTDRSRLLPYLSASLILLIFAAANLLGVKQFWGFNFGKWFPAYASYLTLAVAVLLLIPSVSRRLIDSLSRASGAVVRNRSLRIAFPILVSAALVPLFLSLCTSTALLGDATLRTNQIRKGQFLLATETLDFLLHAGLYRWVFAPLGMEASRCYHIVSAACGVVFVHGIFRLAIYLRPNHALVNFLLLISSGVTVLFFGYIESYSLIAALLPFVMLSALKVVDGKAGRAGFVLWFVIAGLVHSVSAIILAGGLVVVLFLPQGADREQRRRLSRLLWLGLALVLTLAYAARAFDLMGVQHLLLAPFGRESEQLGLIDAQHWWNLLNWLLLSSLPFLFLSPVLFRNRHHRDTPPDGADRRILLATGIAVPSLVFIFLFNAQLGGVRDWDLFSLPVFLLIPATLIVYYAAHNRSLPRQIGSVILISLFVTVSFAVLNNSVVRTVDRFTEAIAVSKFKNQYWEYLNLFDHADRFEEIGNRRPEFAAMAWRQPPRSKVDSIRILDRIHRRFDYDKMDGLVFDHVSRFLGIDSTDLSTHLLLAEYYSIVGMPREEQTALARRLAHLFPENAEAISLAGGILRGYGDLARSGPLITRAFHLDSTNLIVMINYSALIFEPANYERCIGLLNRATAMYPESFQAHYYLALMLIQAGRIDQAREHLRRAERLQIMASDSLKYTTLKKRLAP
ncbi:MAG: hypothetical protein KAV00_14995 [Phycisphaerae bacterium]|nr:hypothetical protein [Phycisphaerae bacterium]